MKAGFLFDSDLCVACKACVSACSLENGFLTGTRSLYQYNKDMLSTLSVINLSLACNHCNDPLCLTGCPAGAYRRDETYNAVIHDVSKCIGCSFCTWRCPFDAPKMNVQKRHIEKCNMCLNRLAEGLKPACVTACPTGALKFSQNDLFISNSSLIPQTAIKPSLSVSGRGRDFKQEEYPETDNDYVSHSDETFSLLKREWSLILFSILVTITSGFTIGRISDHNGSNIILSLSLLLIALSVSVMHLGKKERAWRAFLNLKSSPLSREIAAVTLFFFSLTAEALFSFSLPVITVSMAVLTLITIDMVYISVDKSVTLLTHSGHTLVSALLIASFFTHSVKFFALITFFAVASSVFREGKAKSENSGLLLFFLRQLLLILPLIIMLYWPRLMFSLGTVVMLTGVIIDRILFYLDFDPKNLNNHLKNLTIADYEEKRNKQRQNTTLS